MFPNKTLKIGITKYPKLASISLPDETEYSQVSQLIITSMPEINKKKIILMFSNNLKKNFHLER